MRDLYRSYVHRPRMVDDEPCQVCGAVKGAPCKTLKQKPRLPHMLLQKGNVTIAPYVNDRVDK